MSTRSLGVALAAALLLAACYAPTAPSGAPCTGDDRCPSGQRCVEKSCSLYDAIDAGLDAPPSPPADARPPGTDADVPDSTGCQSPSTCEVAPTLGAISGDTPSAPITRTGHAAAWLRVRVTEDNNEAAGRTLRVAARLMLPPSVDFDVFIYANAAADVVECDIPIGTASTTENVKLVRASWGEGAIANGVNDGRDISIEIRPVASTCAPTQPWMLTVEGNWN
jgi:hypothetical protein